MGRVPMLILYISSEFFQCDHCNIALPSDGSRGLELAIPINEEALPEKNRCSTNLEVGGVDASDICLTDWAWYFFFHRIILHYSCLNKRHRSQVVCAIFL